MLAGCKGRLINSLGVALARWLIGSDGDDGISMGGEVVECCEIGEIQARSGRDQLVAGGISGNSRPAESYSKLRGQLWNEALCLG